MTIQLTQQIPSHALCLCLHRFRTYESIVTMSFPISLHGGEYLEHLRDFRDSALIESHWLGKRRNIGGFTFGIAHAQWLAEEGGTVHLVDEGLRHKRTTITKLMPTTLRIANSPGESGLEVVTFKMDIDDIGCLEIYRNLITDGSFVEFAKADLYKWADRKHGLFNPTDEQRELLYTEMQRGATGLFATASGYGTGQ